MDEKESFLNVALMIEPLPENFDPTSIPTNGMEYLQHVHYEAKHCEPFVAADIDVKKFEKKRNTGNFQSFPVVDTRKDLLPALDWQNEQLAEFSDVRQVIERRRAIQKNHKLFKYKMPVVESRAGWYNFCVGYYEVPDDDAGITQNKDSMFGKQFRTKHRLEKTEPKLHVLSGMSQIAIIQLLEYHDDWIKRGKTDFVHSGPWIYALLASLEIPLIPEVCSTIRSLARSASEHRSKLPDPPEQQSLRILNLVICLVGRYFRQFDLADG